MIFIINILITEIITQPVGSTAVTALEDVTLNCSASVDDVEYSWHHVDDHLPFQSQGQDNDMFTIYGATPHDEGVYYCMATKSGISAKSSNALVKVDGK